MTTRTSKTIETTTRTFTLLALTFGAANACRSAADEAPTTTDRAALIARGEHLVATGGCHDCHTPLVMGPEGPTRDLSRALSGHPEQMVMPPAPALPEGPWLGVVGATQTAYAGPWGTTFTANLTPDPDTGLGRWSLADFVATVRTGRRMGKGRPVLPPMPIEVMQRYSDDELAAMFAYLQSLPPIVNRVPTPIAPTHAAAGAPPVTPSTGATALSKR